LSGGSLTLSFAGQANLSFDGEGRLLGAWLDEITYRRALDNRILAKWTKPGGRDRYRRFLSTAGRKAVLQRAYEMAHQVITALSSGRIFPRGTPEGALENAQQWLHRVESWTWERLETERERFYRIYKPVPILPPDQYMAVVLQATEGCSYNRCTFCTFYRDRPFRIKTPKEFGAHAAAVRAFLGRGLEVRKTIFLADANAVIIHQQALLPILDQVNAQFPVLAKGELKGKQDAESDFPSRYLKGIYAFISAPDALRKSPEDFEAMRTRNLRRVYVGLESGHNPLRSFLRKPGTANDVLAAIQTMKAGGMHLGVIFMVGIGGDRFREGHFHDTVELIQRMPLDEQDLIYVSPFVASPAAPYVYDAAEAGIRALDRNELLREEKRFKKALRPWARVHGVRISRYDIREFVY